jgi:hypothetical protein
VGPPLGSQGLRALSTGVFGGEFTAGAVWRRLSELMLSLHTGAQPLLLLRHLSAMFAQFSWKSVWSQVRVHLVPAQFLLPSPGWCADGSSTRN